MVTPKNFISYKGIVKKALDVFLEDYKKALLDVYDDMDNILLENKKKSSCNISNVRCRFSLIDNFYKMKSLLNQDIDDEISGEKSKDLTRDLHSNSSRKFTNNSYILGGSYGSYSSRSSYSSYTSNGFFGSYGSYRGSFSSHFGSFSSWTSPYFTFYCGGRKTRDGNIDFVNERNMTFGQNYSKKPNIRIEYKNEYLYKAANIKQEFFVMGYGLELI